MHFGNYVSANQISMGVFLVKVAASVIIAFFLASLFRYKSRSDMRRRYEAFKRDKYNKDMESPEKRYAYDDMEDWMLAVGIKYRMGSNFTPFDYMVLRILIGLVVGVIAALFNPWLFALGFAGVWVLVPYYFMEQNANDNEAMLTDIGRLNSITALQIKNGVYVSKVIYEAYRTVEHPRLKQALLELSIDIENFSSIEQAAKQFKKKFSNQHIETYAKVLEQIQETGQSLEFFQGIEASIDRINEAVAIIAEKKAERIASVFQLILFLGPILIVFFILIGSFSANGLF